MGTTHTINLGPQAYFLIKFSPIKHLKRSFLNSNAIAFSLKEDKVIEQGEYIYVYLQVEFPKKKEKPLKLSHRKQTYIAGVQKSFHLPFPLGFG